LLPDGQACTDFCFSNGSGCGLGSFQPASEPATLLKVKTKKNNRRAQSQRAFRVEKRTYRILKSLLMKLAIKTPKQAIPIKWNDLPSSGVSIIHRRLQDGAACSPHDEQRYQAEELTGLDAGGRPSTQPSKGSPYAKRHVDRNVRRAAALDFFGLLIAFSVNSQAHIYPVVTKW
jgi:hypothetical protein